MTYETNVQLHQGARVFSDVDAEHALLGGKSYADLAYLRAKELCIRVPVAVPKSEGWFSVVSLFPRYWRENLPGVILLPTSLFGCKFGL